MAEKITEEQVRHVAKLARLKLSDEEIHRFAQQMSDMLAYVDKLGELDVDGVEPMAHAVDMVNALRTDEARPGEPADEMLKNAPQRYEDYFRVPKVLGDGGGA
jgi:aspartyl-tRNA(Asn)/glutamyl-tRNA(Gln) amidotransferase subunit C